MKKILIGSVRESAGKTSIILALAGTLDKSATYLKPLGDRLVYRRKINWDYDAELIRELWKLSLESRDITLGFNHSKLRYTYPRESLAETVSEMIEKNGRAADVCFIEGGRDIAHGASIHLDTLSLSGHAGCEPVIIISGEADTVMDDLTFIREYLYYERIKLKGVIFNKVPDIDDFSSVHLPQVEKTGIPVLGMLPQKIQLTHFSMQYLAERFIAKVLAGENGLKKKVKNIFVGAMSTGESLRNPLFNKENKLLITSGDRHDMILAALESDTVGVILTNNILPATNLVSKAAENDIPLLLVNQDTYQVARSIDRMDALITRYDEDKLKLLTQMAERYLDIEKILAQ